MTVGAERDGFRRWLEARGRSLSTIANYLRAVDPFERFLARRHLADLRAVTRQDVDAYAAELAGAGRYTTQTQRAMLRGLKRFYEYLCDASKVFASPAEHLRDPREKRLLGHVLPEAEVRKLLDAPNTGLPHGIRDRAILELLYATGLRRKEICGLCVYDLDLDGGLVRVRGKGDHERLVPLTGAAQRWLREYLREVRPRFARHAAPGERRLFLSVRGIALGPEVLGMTLRRCGKVAGVARVSCHAFRRTVATSLLRGGADVRSVGEVLGHAGLDATQRYTKLVAADLREVQARTHPRAKVGGTQAR